MFCVSTAVWLGSVSPAALWLLSSTLSALYVYATGWCWLSKVSCTWPSG